MSADMGKDYETWISQNTEEKSLRRVSLLIVSKQYIGNHIVKAFNIFGIKVILC